MMPVCVFLDDRSHFGRHVQTHGSGVDWWLPGSVTHDSCITFVRIYILRIEFFFKYQIEKRFI